MIGDQCKLSNPMRVAGEKHPAHPRIERMNGTLRERVKGQRGWKSMNTPIAEGQRIQYDFVKPHVALDGETPAEKARDRCSRRQR